MDHPDFRVGGRSLRLLAIPKMALQWSNSPDRTRDVCQSSADGLQAVQRVCGGRRGATNVNLKSARQTSHPPWLLAAWRLTAPKQLQHMADPEEMSFLRLQKTLPARFRRHPSCSRGSRRPVAEVLGAVLDGGDPDIGIVDHMFPGFPPKWRGFVQAGIALLA